MKAALLLLLGAVLAATDTNLKRAAPLCDAPPRSVGALLRSLGVAKAHRVKLYKAGAGSSLDALLGTTDAQLRLALGETTAVGPRARIRDALAQLRTCGGGGGGGGSGGLAVAAAAAAATAVEVGADGGSTPLAPIVREELPSAPEEEGGDGEGEGDEEGEEEEGEDDDWDGEAAAAAAAAAADAAASAGTAAPAAVACGACDFDALLAWARRGGAVIDDRVLIDGRSRTMHVSAAVPPSTALVALPPSLLLRWDAADADTAHNEAVLLRRFGARGGGGGGAAGSAGAARPPWVQEGLLAVVLLREIAAASASRWAPYLACLPPPAACDSLLCAGDAELAAGLPPSEGDALAQDRALLGQAWAEMRWPPPLLAARGGAPPPLPLFLWAVSRASSRAGLVGGGGGGAVAGDEQQQLAMMPVLDMANHDASAAPLAAQGGGDGGRGGGGGLALVVGGAPSQAIAAGGEVRLKYVGRFGALHMMGVYGFVPNVIDDPVDGGDGGDGGAGAGAGTGAGAGAGAGGAERQRRSAMLEAHAWYELQTVVEYKQQGQLRSARRLLEALSGGAGAGVGGELGGAHALRITEGAGAAGGAPAAAMTVQFDLSRGGIPPPTLALFRLLVINDSRLLGAPQKNQSNSKKEKKMMKKRKKHKKGSKQQFGSVTDLSVRLSARNEEAALRLLLQAVASVTQGFASTLEQELQRLPSTRAAAAAATAAAAAAVAAGAAEAAPSGVHGREQGDDDARHERAGRTRRAALMAEYRIFRLQLVRDTTAAVDERLRALGAAPA